MKKELWLLCFALLLVACKDKVPNEIEMYGNTFGRISSGKFDVPDDWVRYNLMDSACSIMMPPTMKETFLDGVDIIDKDKGTNFSFHDSTDNMKHYYSRVAVDYIKATKGTFAMPDEWALSTENIMALDEMVDGEIKDRSLILNGPYFDCSTTNQMFKNNKLTHTYYLDTYYRRKSITGDSPVSVHIFFLQNDDKMVKMMIAYHDKDSLIFQNLFNSIKTFEWN